MSSNEKTPQLSSPCYGMPPKTIKCEIFAPPPMRPVISCDPKLEQNKGESVDKTDENKAQPNE